MYQSIPYRVGSIKHWAISVFKHAYSTQPNEDRAPDFRFYKVRYAYGEKISRNEFCDLVMDFMVDRVDDDDVLLIGNFFWFTHEQDAIEFKLVFSEYIV